MAVPPTIRWSHWAASGVSPSGSRHLTSHPTYIKQLGTAADQELDFGSVNNTNGKVHSLTCAVTAGVDAMNGANEAIFNMRFWIPDFSDYTTGTFFFNGVPSGTWIQNIALTDASGYFIPTALPSGQNLFRQDEGLELTGASADAQVTEFVYLSVSVDTDVPPNVYGGAAGGHVYRLTYDFK
ncbi:hypothetical protein KAR91_50015 [Candidatus Pacearchaeota archaeon]|nr:hypothetical protein [Candidatus Pacearchaeota archaeon]